MQEKSIHAAESFINRWIRQLSPGAEQSTQIETRFLQNGRSCDHVPSMLSAELDGLSGGTRIIGAVTGSVLAMR
jgi:hypothetical protein